MTSHAIKNKFVLVSLVTVFLISSFFVVFPTEVSADAGASGRDEGAPSCNAIGVGLDGDQQDDLNPFTASDFGVEIISRGEIRVFPSSSGENKNILRSGNGDSLSTIMGGGCIIYLDDNPLTLTENYPHYTVPTDPGNLFWVDQIRTSGASYRDQADDIVLEGLSFLGEVDTAAIESVELNFVIAYEDLDGPDPRYYLTTEDSGETAWKYAQRMETIINQRGLIITNIENKQNFNRSLILGGEPGALTLSTIEGFGDNIVFSEANSSNGTERIFALNRANLDEGFFGFSDGGTPESLSSATGFVELLYYNDTNDTNPRPILVLGGAADAPDSTTSSPAADSGENNPSCEGEGGEFSWLLCPALRQIDSLVSYLDNQINSLLYTPASYTEADQIEATWARMRNLAYFLLIPILLVMVIGTALGFNFVDAYTVKRALPRLFVATIFIALSLPLLQLFVEVINGVGLGVNGIISSAGSGDTKISLEGLFNPNPAQSGVLTTGAIGGGIAALLTIKVWIGAALLLGITVLISLFTIFILLALRQLLIVALIVVAPLAILAWIFPGNDKGWKIWWGSFSKLLLLYPIIMGLLAIGRVFASVVQDVGPGGLVEVILKLVAYIGPFFLIPATFKYAGGVFASVGGMANDKNRGVFDRLKKRRQKSLGTNWERGPSRRITQARADWQNRLQTESSKGGALRRNTLGRLAGAGSGVVGGYNITAQDSARRAAVGKELNEQIATGRDDEIRGLSVNKAWALKHGVEGEDYRTDKKSKVRQFRTLGGSWVNEGAVDDGHAKWGKDTYAQQTALSYEMRKAMETGQVERISQNFGHVSEGRGGWGMSSNQASGAMIGAGFENQNQSLEFKYMRRQTDSNDNVTGYGLDYEGFSKEMYEKRGSYALSNMSGNTINRLTEAYNNGDAETQNRLRSVAETFVHRGASGMGQQIGADGDTPRYAPPEPGDTTAPTDSSYSMVSAQGPGSVNEKIAEFARVTGVLNTAPSAPFRRTGAGSDQKGQEPPAPEIIPPGDPRHRV